MGLGANSPRLSYPHFSLPALSLTFSNFHYSRFKKRSSLWSNNGGRTHPKVAYFDSFQAHHQNFETGFSINFDFDDKRAKLFEAQKQNVDEAFILHDPLPPTKK
ncbi:hypothetical protein TorRG33x02_066650, partial [Trema orientale]